MSDSRTPDTSETNSNTSSGSEARTGSKARLLSGTDMEQAELHAVAAGFAAVYTNASPTKPGQNEDSCALIPYGDKSGILVVADGAGGLPSADRASRTAIESLQKALKKGLQNETALRDAILDGIEQASRTINSWGVGAATTLAIAELDDDALRTYHVGDSQILVIGQRGKLKLETKSHSPVGYAVEAGLIQPEEALFHDDRHLVSNFVGDPEMNIEIGTTIKLAPRDTVLVATDGLFDNLRTAEIIDACRKGRLLGCSHSLTDTSLARMNLQDESAPSKPDDLTFILYRKRNSED